MRPMLCPLVGIAVVMLGPSHVSAQAVVKPIARDVDVAYGLDALRLRITSVAVRVRTPRGPVGRDRPVSFLPLPVRSRYLVVNLTVRNAGRIPENIPLFATTLRLGDGSAVDPAVYGPFIGEARTEAPTSTVIAPHSSLALHLIVGDVPNDRTVQSLILSPNDATSAYRFELEERAAH